MPKLAPLERSVAFFSSVKGRTGTNTRLREVLDGIRGGRWRREIESLRQLDGTAYNAAKKKLAAVMASASTRNGGHKESDILDYSGLLLVDIDDVGKILDAAELRDRLRVDPHVCAAWVSPGGRGVKAIIVVESNLDSHRFVFEEVRAYFLRVYTCEIDESCSDPSRLSFVSFDPDLWLNESATPFPTASGALDVAEMGKSPKGNKRRPGSARRLNGKKGQSPSNSSELSTPSILYNKIFGYFPSLRQFYQAFVARKFAGLQPGHRNESLIDMVTFLMVAIHSKFIPDFAEEFYHQNRSVFGDSLDVHLKEAHSQLRNALERYFIRLTADEKDVYLHLDEDGRSAFRICRALASRHSDDSPAGEFFLSANQLGARLALLDVQAHRILKTFQTMGVILLTEKGTQWQRNQRPIASRYQWLLSLETGNGLAARIAGNELPGTSPRGTPSLIDSETQGF